MEINGIQVVDAKKPVTLIVRKSDIKGARRKNPTACAAARAACRQFKAAEARVNRSRTLVLMPDGKYYRFKTPFSLRTEICAIDKGGRFEPGEYTLKPFNESLKLGQRRAEPEKRTNRGPAKKKMQAPRHMTVGVRGYATRS